MICIPRLILFVGSWMCYCMETGSESEDLSTELKKIFVFVINHLYFQLNCFLAYLSYIFFQRPALNSFPPI